MTGLWRRAEGAPCPSCWPAPAQAYWALGACWEQGENIGRLH